MPNIENSTILVDLLIPYANNSRKHSDEQITQLASNISAFGFTNPVLVDENNGLIAGHGRLMAAKKLGMSEVPARVISGLTKAEKKALVIADNKLGLNSEWDNRYCSRKKWSRCSFDGN